MSSQYIKCPSCGADASPKDDKCPQCGNAIAKVTQIIYVDAPVAFAAGLPEWSIEPPVVAVRRKAKI
jgi:uncharacterized OB-fold protein